MNITKMTIIPAERGKTTITVRVTGSIKHYRKNGLVKRKHNPYKRPYHYMLSNKGISQLVWLEEFLAELLLDFEI